jgi:putative nucleotidyltransferase with HDIG domain
VARSLGGNPDEAYSAGLLHDLGDLVLFRNDVARHVEANDGATARTLIERERAAMGRDHTEVGAELLREWSVPDRVCAAVRSHHAAPEGVTGTLARSVWAGAKVGYHVAKVGLVEPWSVGAVLQIVGIDEKPDRILAEIERDLGSIVARVGAR